MAETKEKLVVEGESTSQPTDAKANAVDQTGETTNDEDAADLVEQLLSLTITSPFDLPPLNVGVLRHDVVGDILKQIFESESHCFLTSFALSFEGKVLPEWEELANIPKLVSGSTLQLVEQSYDPRSARAHLRRLRHFLAGPIPNQLSGSSISVLVDLMHSPNDSASQPNSSSSRGPTQSSNNESNNKQKKGNNKNKQKGNRGSKGSQQQQQQQRQQQQQQQASQQSSQGKHPSDRLLPDAPLDRYFPPTTHSATARCIKSLTYSGWNPPPGHRTLRGDLFYIEVHTLEDEQFFVTAATDGFFVNSSTATEFNPAPHGNPKFRCHYLAGLLSALSPAFKANFQTLLGQHFEREPLECVPVVHPPHSWVATRRAHTYNLNRAEDALVLSSEGPHPEQKSALRDWNFDYQLLRDHPTTGVMDRLIRDCALYKFNSEFVDEATKGVVDIISGSVSPLNPLDPLPAQMFLYNNIFFSFCTDSRDLYVNAGGDMTAYKMTNNDLAGLKHFISVNVKELHTVPTAVIDYKGWRMIAQGVIPGILNSETPSSLVYGSTLPTDPLVAKEPCSALMATVAEKLHIKKHSLVDNHDNTIEFTASPVTKGIMGTDGRIYVLDLFRMTPRDANFLEPKDISKLLRYELVARFRTVQIGRKVHQIDEEQRAKSAAEQQSSEGKPEISAAEAEAQAAAKLQSDLKDIAKIAEEYKFNVDVFSDLKLAGDKDQIGLDEQLVRELSSFLMEEAIPSLLFEWARFINVPGDGQKLCDTLHIYGINLRYLGVLAQHILPHTPIRRLIFQEMAARAAKHIFNKMLRLNVTIANTAQAVAYFLNSLVGKAGLLGKYSVIKNGGCPYDVNSLWTAIGEHIAEYFSFGVPVSELKECLPLSLVRRFCQLVGVQILARRYDFSQSYPFTEDDVLDIVPKVKHVQPHTSDGTKMLKAGREHYQNGRHDFAYDYLNEAHKIFHQVYGYLHLDCAQTFSLTANMFYSCGDLPSAVNAQRKAVIIYERVLGLDAGDTIRAYAQLGLYVGSLDPAYATKCLLRARYLAELIGGEFFPERAAILTNIAVLLQEQGRFAESLEYLHEALHCNFNTFGPEDLRTAATFHAVAMAHYSVQQYREALEFEKQCYNINKARLGEEEKATIQSNTWLKEFTKKAVESAQQQAIHVANQPKVSIPTTSARRGFLPQSRIPVTTQARKQRQDLLRLAKDLPNAEKLQAQAKAQ